MDDEYMDFILNIETGELEPRKEPYCVLEFETEEDFLHFKEMVKFYKEHHNMEEKRGTWKEIRIVRCGNGKPYTTIAHECSECKWLNKHKKGWNTKFCPNCRADMRGEE